MSQYPRSGTRPGNHEPYYNDSNDDDDDGSEDHDDSDDDDGSEGQYTSSFFTDPYARNEIIEILNDDLPMYDLDESFFSHYDDHGRPSLGGRGRHVSHGGADRPTPPEMEQLLSEIVDLGELTPENASTVLWAFCSAIPEEHPYYTAFGLETFPTEDPTATRRSGRSEYDMRGDRMAHRGGHTEHTESHRSMPDYPYHNSLSSYGSGSSTGSEDPILRWARTQLSEDIQQMIRDVRSNESETSHRAEGSHYIYRPRYLPRRHGGYDEPDSDPDSYTLSHTTPTSRPDRRSQYPH